MSFTSAAAPMAAADLRLILSLSKDEASHGGRAVSPFDRLRMRLTEAFGPDARLEAS